MLFFFRRKAMWAAFLKRFENGESKDVLARIVEGLMEMVTGLDGYPMPEERDVDDGQAGPSQRKRRKTRDHISVALPEHIEINRGQSSANYAYLSCGLDGQWNDCT